MQVLLSMHLPSQPETNQAQHAVQAFSAGRNAEGLSRRFNNTRIIIGYVEPTSGTLLNASVQHKCRRARGAPHALVRPAVQLTLLQG